MKIIIIEDEILAAEKLTNFIKKYDSEVEILATLDSIRACLDWFEKNEIPDLIFSDIELLDGNVFSFFQHKKITCPIIFATAYDEFLMKAFNENGIAYLLKPFDFKAFQQAMGKYEQLKNNFKNFDDFLMDKIKTSFSRNEKDFKKRFAVKTAKGIFIINVDEIAFIRAEEGLVFCITKNQKKFTLNHSLNELEQLLNPTVFFRLNRSEIINVNFIEKLENYFNDRLSVSLRNFKEKLISSASRTAALRRWIDK
ncbi:MAG: LytR/AlgR family response regulator transcription factor [Saprospiraceae bacterium]